MEEHTFGAHRTLNQNPIIRHGAMAFWRVERMLEAEHPEICTADDDPNGERRMSETQKTSSANLDNRMIIWIRHCNRGISSEVIFETLSGNLLLDDDWGYSTPQDAGDFKRCYELLQLIPEWRTRLNEVAEKHPHWKLIVEHWGELESLFKEALNDKTAPNPFWKFNSLLGKLNKYRYAPEKHLNSFYNCHEAGAP